jgi:aryl carrier-like protein
MTTDSEIPPPATDVDAIRRRIIEIWTSVLRGPEVHDDSDLVDLGATSLTAVRIRSRIRAELGRDIDLVDLLDHPTPRELAPVVAAAEPWTGVQAWQQLDWSTDPPDGETG